MRLIAAAVLAICLALPAHADDPPAPGACFTSEQEFLESALRVNKAKVMMASAHARNVIVDRINAARAEAKLWAFEADKLAIGVISYDGRLVVGVVMFKDGCVVPGSVQVVQADAFIAFITDVGLSMDDFKPEEGA